LIRDILLIAKGAIDPTDNATGASGTSQLSLFVVASVTKLATGNLTRVSIRTEMRILGFNGVGALSVGGTGDTRHRNKGANRIPKVQAMAVFCSVKID
jgi:hypothetical protein